MTHRRYRDYWAGDADTPMRRRRREHDVLPDEDELLDDVWYDDDRTRVPSQGGQDVGRGRSGFDWNDLPVWTGVAILLFVVAVGGGLWLMTRDSDDRSPGDVRSQSANGGGTPAATVRSATPGGPTPIIVADTPAPPTPDHVAVGVRVVIAGTGADRLRVRAGPGTDYATLMIVPDGTEFRVLEGPQAQGGYVWWRMQAADGTTGWAAEQFLRPIGQ